MTRQAAQAARLRHREGATDLGGVPPGGKVVPRARKEEQLNEPDAGVLSLVPPAYTPAQRWLLRFWCHRTGKRSRDASTPLYRLRSAVSRLWLAYLPSAHPVLQSSG